MDILVIICIFCSFNYIASAETLSSHIKGDTVLCNAGFGFGHAALMNKDELLYQNGNEVSNSIIEVHSIFHPVSIGNYSDFVNNNTFLGYYSPKTVMSDYKKEQVLSRATQLKSFSDAGDIIYTVIGQLSYSGYDTVNYYNQGPKKLIQPINVDQLRCDGFVEYCYEHENIRISGNDSNWNVSFAETENQNFHNSSLNTISPKIQAYVYMKSMVGDLDEDGAITTSDSRIALRIAVNLDTPAAFHRFVGDVDDDGEVTTEDSRLILRYAIQLENTFTKDTNIRNNNPNNSLGFSAEIIELIWSGQYPIILCN